MMTKRSGAESSDQLQFFKDYQGRILSNPRYQALPMAAKLVFLHLRMIAANNGRDGAIRLAGQHDAPATFKELVGLVQGLIGASGEKARDQARETLESVIEAKLFIRDRKQVVWVANAEEEWARWSYSDKPEARRQRESRARRGRGGDVAGEGYVTDCGAPPAGGSPCAPRTENDEIDRNDGPKRTKPTVSSVTSTVTSLPTSKIRFEEDETTSRLRIVEGERREEAAELPTTTRSAQGEPPAGGRDEDFYNTPPVELWMRLTGERCEITERTARKYHRLLGHNLFMQCCAELRDAIRDKVDKHPGKLGSSILTREWDAIEEKRKRGFGFGSQPVAPVGASPVQPDERREVTQSPTHERPMSDVFGDDAQVQVRAQIVNDLGATFRHVEPSTGEPVRDARFYGRGRGAT